MASGSPLGYTRLRWVQVHLERPLWRGADLGLLVVYSYGLIGLHNSLLVEESRSGKLGCA